MPSDQKYTRPAITEAVLDIQIEPRREPTLKELDRIWSKVKDRYSRKAPLYQGQFHFGLTQQERGAPRASAGASAAEPVGIAFRAGDDWVFQAGLKSFTCSRVGPYVGWTRFIAESKSLWPLYAKEVKVKRFTRLAVRYINRFDLPEIPVELKDYFRTGPEIAPELPQIMDGFFMQTQLPLPEAGATVLINQTIVPPAKPDHLSVLLDMDLFQTQNLGDTDEEMWAVFEHLRTWKNRVFEACITEKTRKLIR